MAGDQGLIDGWVNEGVTDFLLRTRLKVSPATMTLTSGEDDYTLPTGILQIIDLYTTSGGNSYRLERVTPFEILELRRASGSTDSPARRYAVAGSNLLMVYPTPDAADTVTLYYVPRPATLSSGSDTPSEIPSEFHKAIELFALAEAADYDDDQTSAQGQRYRDEYEKWVQRARRAVTLKGGSRLAPTQVGRRRFVPHDSSADF